MAIAPLSDDLADRFFSYMSRHLVVLAYEYETFDKGKPFHRGAATITGFVIQLHDEWYWTTAGHCLQDLDSLIRKGQLRILRSSFMDYFGPKSIDATEYPFQYEPGCSISVYDMDDADSIGMDFGLIQLDYLTKANFEANGVVCIDRTNWMNQESVKFDHYRLLGVPENEVGEIERINGRDVVGVQPVMVTVRRLDPSEVNDVPSSTCFVGRIHEKADLPTVKGMSGGPIYGFVRKDDGQWAYHVAALQSKWRPESRVVFGCSLQHFAERAHQVIGLLKGTIQFETGEAEYAFDDFVQHFKDINDLLETDSGKREGLTARLVGDYLMPKYPLFKDRLYKVQRIMDIMRYLQLHEAEFVRCGLVTKTSSDEGFGDVIGALLFSIHQFFTTLPISQLKAGVPAEDVIAFAESCRLDATDATNAANG